MIKIKMNNFGEMVDCFVLMYGYDDNNNEYSVYFDLLDSFDLDNPDLSDSCDWNKPIEIWCNGEEIDFDNVKLEY